MYYLNSKISYQNKEKKINHFPGTIVIATIFKLNFYILAFFCFIMFAFVYTYGSRFGPFAWFWSYLTCFEFFLWKTGIMSSKSLLLSLCVLCFLFVCPDLFVLIGSQFLGLLYPYPLQIITVYISLNMLYNCLKWKFPPLISQNCRTWRYHSEPI